MGDLSSIPGSGRSPGEVLGSFNGPGPGSPEVTIRKVKDRKRLILPGLCREPVKSLTALASLMKTPGALSKGSGVGW